MDEPQDLLAATLADARAPGEPVVLRLHRDPEGTARSSSSAPAETRRATMRRSISTRCSQAIEEGFILDVLKGYATYRSYWRIGSAAAEDPDVDKAKAAAQLARFVSAPPDEPRPEGRGDRRALPQSHAPEDRWAREGDGRHPLRLHAVRYKQAIDAYIHEKGYGDVHTLVAF